MNLSVKLLIFYLILRVEISENSVNFGGCKLWFWEDSKHKQFAHNAKSLAGPKVVDRIRTRGTQESDDSESTECCCTNEMFINV